VTLQATRSGLAPTTPTPPGAPGTDAAAPGPDPLPAPDAAGLLRLETGTPGRRPRRWTVALRLVLPVSIFAAWWILTTTGVIQSTTLSSPAATWDAFVELWRHQDLLGDIGVSARRAVLGLALGAGVGLILGIVVGLTRLGEELFDASMQMLRMVPYPAVIFLFIIWFGIGEMAKVLLIGLATLFPMYLNTSNGVRNVDRRVVEAARCFGVKGWQLVRRVVVPLALPSIMTGLRFSAGISVIALVFTESIGANQGIGYLVAQADSLQQIPVLVVCVVIYALLGIGADLSVRLLESVTMPWRRHQAVR
jgi:sulfonate transport system permease protein